MRIPLLLMFGSLGVGLRFLINRFASQFTSVEPHFATLAINLLGSFCIGYISTLTASDTLLNEATRAAITVGLLGGFTTFSAFSLDSLQLLSQGRYVMAASYIFVSVAGGLCATFSGMRLGSL